ncbi:hypothetical protein MYX76_07210 [Desulfobacterota bacterium AH_259_B03_O07]|nr:hypothetical protein [Desulfobacterota bacterium AH_259_B03_O07]
MKILIPSVGGMGVGVLVEWLSRSAMYDGLKPNVLNLPGVSQRTGRTLSYIEIHNEDDITFSPFPEKGKLDLIISQDFLELLQIIKEGYGGNNCNILATTYRYYTTYEKLSLKKDSYTYENFRDVIEANSKDHIVVDIHKMGISDFKNSHLLGLLSCSGYLPLIKRESCEKAIRDTGLEVERNLKDFAFGYGILEKNQKITEGEGVVSKLYDIPDGYIKESTKKLESAYGTKERDILIEAIKQLIDYENIEYAELYINRVNDLHFYLREIIGETKECEELMAEFAKVLAIRMMYEDVIRVAERKASKERFKRIKRLYRIQNEDIFWVKDFFRPGVDELYGILPHSMGKLMDRLFSRYGFSWKSTINTNHVFGFLFLKLMSKLKFMRKHSFRYRKENDLIEKYIDHVKRCIVHGVDSALLAANGGAIVRGYGEIRREMISNWKEFSNLNNSRMMVAFIDHFFSEKRFENQKQIRMKSN